MPKVVLSDSSVNSYGFRLLTEGAQLDQFRKNPVMLLMHDRRLLPIGTWENIGIEGDHLVADPKFDEDDELAQKVKKKWDKGIMRATSVGIDVIETSEDPQQMVPGQTRPTVTKWEPYEASIVDIGSNRNALKLRNAQGLVLEGNVKSEYLDILLPTIPQRMKAIALALGLPETATEQEIQDAIAKLKADKVAEATTLQAAPPAGKPEGTAKALAATIIALGKSKGVVTDENEAHYTTLAGSDPDAVLGIINSAPAGAAEGAEADTAGKKKEFSMAELVAQLKGGSPKDEGPKTWDEYQEKDPNGLKTLMKEKPEEFKKLYKAKYGVDPKL